MRPVHATLLSLSLALAACADGSLTPAGGACAEDAQCASAFCYGSTCLAPDGDEDDDGLTNAEERALRTDPARADTDGDGLPDLIEVDGDVSAPRDSDGDGVPDVLESALADADLDCIGDQLDPDDAGRETDLAVVAAAVCRTQGVCAPPAVVTVTCLQTEGPDGAGSRAVCDYSQIPAYDPGTELRCDGADNDCDGTTDEDLGYTNPTVGDAGDVLAVGAACFGTGACRAKRGVVECHASGRAICSVNHGGTDSRAGPYDLDCDGVDNDCDGSTDEGVTWPNPATGGLALFGERCVARGACGLEAGKVECHATTGAGLCSTEPDGSEDLSGPEICNGRDDDCDGLTDEGLAWTALDGTQRPLGAPCGTGACAGGAVVCGASGRAVCSTVAATGGLEDCDGVDDDCDGLTDEPDGVALGCPRLGVCAAAGRVAGSCEDGERVCRYEGAAFEPGDERSCNDLDDDCDGSTDEGLEADGQPLGASCDGHGECAGAMGVVVCAPSGVAGVPPRAVCSTNLTGGPELCDGLDNDCDGGTDELDPDAPGGGVCAAVGVCADHVDAQAACSAGGWVCPYEADPAWEIVETSCDGLDNDCDGRSDEDARKTLSGAWRAVPGAQPPDRAPWPIAATDAGPILFGGAAPGPRAPLLGDLWRFHANASAWEPLPAPGGPRPRAGHALAWEPLLGRVVVHGGAVDGPDEVPVESARVLSDELWLFDPQGRTWAPVQQDASALTGAALARRDHAIVALGDGRLLLHGGDGPALIGAVSASGEDLVTYRCVWKVAVAGPPPRHRHVLVRAPGSGVVALVGGEAMAARPAGAGAGALAAPVLLWDGTETGAWVPAPTDAAMTLDALGAWPAAAFDAAGALTVTGAREGAAFRLSPAADAWTPLSGAVRGEGGAMWTTGGEGLTYLVGARDGVSVRATQRLPAGGVTWGPPEAWAGPPPRDGGALVVAPHATFLIGGWRAPTGFPAQDAWVREAGADRFRPLVTGSVVPVAAAGAAPAARFATGFWDGPRSRVVLAGGEGGGGAVWALDPATNAFVPVLAGDDPDDPEAVAVFGPQGLATAAVAWAFGRAAGGRVGIWRLDLMDPSWEAAWSGDAGEMGPAWSDVRAGGVDEVGVRVVFAGADELLAVRTWSFAARAWTPPTHLDVPWPPEVAGTIYDVDGAQLVVIAGPPLAARAWHVRFGAEPGVHGTALGGAPPLGPGLALAIAGDAVIGFADREWRFDRECPAAP